MRCPLGCKIEPRLLEITTQDGPIPEPRASDSRPLEPEGVILEVPLEPGRYRWTVGGREDPDHSEIVHDLRPLVIQTRVKAHDASVAVWGVPGPIVGGTPFTIRVGVKCDRGCDIGGARVGILNERGAMVGEALLASDSHGGSSGLYVAHCELTAPGKCGLHSWSVSLPDSHLEMETGRAAGVFGFVVVEEPDYAITVEVVERKTRAPIEHADVRLGVYRGITDEDGVANLEVAEGCFNLVARKIGYHPDSRTIDVTRDVRLRVDLEPAPPKNPDDDIAWM